MEVLKLNILCLTFMGLCLKHPVGLTNRFLKSFESYFFLAIFTCVSFLGGCVYIVRKNFDFDASVQAYISLSGGFAAFCSFASMGANMEKIEWLINEYQAIANRGK